MTQTAAYPAFPCPTCSAMLSTPAPGATACPRCGWAGEAYLFNPKPITAAAAEMALPDDAACLHHPSKRATAVCAGTGDYICSLCSVEIEGNTYSAQYLDAGGRAKAAKAFDRKLPRPDRYIYTYLILLFVPYVNFILIPFTFLWVPHAYILYRRALKERRENPLFARLMSKRDVIVLPTLVSIVAIAWLAGVIALAAWGMEKHR